MTRFIGRDENLRLGLEPTAEFSRLIIYGTSGEDLRGQFTRAETEMIKRSVLLAAAIGGAVLSMVIAPDPAWAERRVALVIGNSNYESVERLPNPARDAAAVAKLFEDAKFDSVDIKFNLGVLDFKRTIRKFENDADRADVAVIYYAGHGLEINGNNYLIPVDAKLANDRDVEDEAVLLNRVVASAAGSNKFSLIILDACRDNPFKAGMKEDRKANSGEILTLGSIDLSGVADTLTAYAAKVGSTAEGGAGDHSPFTTALLNNLTVPGLDVRMAFGRIRNEVMAATGGRQEPFVYGSLGNDNYALVPTPATQEASTAEMKADFDFISSINTKRAWEVYLSRYSTGPYADRARQQLASLANEIPPQPPVTSQGNPSVTSVDPSGNAEAAKRAASLPNSFELVRAAQGQLARLGCFSGRMDGNLISTKSALAHYLLVKGQPTNNPDVTEGLVADLTRQTDRVCPVECLADEVAKGEICVAADEPVTPSPAVDSGRKNIDDEDDARARRKQAIRERDESRRSKSAPEAPRAREQALARSGTGSRAGGGGVSVSGLGF